MTVLRSREVLPLSPTPKSLKTPANTLQPSTPSQPYETHLPHSPLPLSSPFPATSVTDSTGLPSDCVASPGVFRRRSSRLAAKGHSAEDSATKMKADQIDTRDSGLASGGKLGVGSICSGVEVLEVYEGVEEGLIEARRSIDFGYTGSKSDKVNGKRKLIPDINLPSEEFVDESPENKACLSLRSGKRVLKTVKHEVVVDRRHNNGDDLVEDRRNIKDNDNDAIARNEKGEVVMKELKEECSRIDENDCTIRRNRFSRREKGKWIVDGPNSNKNNTNVPYSEPNVGELSGNLVEQQNYWSVHERPMGIEIEKGKRKLAGASYNDAGHLDANSYTPIDECGNTTEENGEGKLIAEALLSLSEEVLIDPKMRYEYYSVEGEVSDAAHLTGDGPQNDESESQDTESSSDEEVNIAAENRRWLYQQQLIGNPINYLRSTALEFARVSNDDGDNRSGYAKDDEGEIEDWPGPFHTAMKIASDRATKSLRVTKYSEENKPAPVKWTPRKNKCRSRSKSLPPSLRDLCLWVLAKNADAICSLDFVPDAFRHKLSRLLCDSRKMNSHFLDLLLCGSPTEVCIRDCSWLSEEEFVKSFHGCDTSKLMMLQLDQCGRCIPDYVLLSTLAQSSNSLPALNSLSLSGACRLSDIGMAALVSSAPALQSLNLSQCSFLTSSSIDSIANSLGSTLTELYLDDCQNLDPMLMISAMKKLEHLEVLSLAGMGNVCDEFIQEFVTAGGPNLKELILTNCVKLTNKSIKAISETCSALCAIDLVNLSKLSDYALCCLANGCPVLQKLKLSRNQFSDDAVAAFVEISGGSLKELSLNNVKGVSRSTAISLACFSKNLVSLDLSWCRKLTNEALGLIVDNCPSLRVLKLFGCSQVTNVFLDGHSNPEIEIIGLKLSPIWPHVEPSNPHQGPSYFSAVPTSC